MIRHAAIMREFYNAMTGQEVTQLSDIPDEVLQFMAGMSHHQMVHPLIVRGLRIGVGTRVLADVHGVSRGLVKRIKRRYKL